MMVTTSKKDMDVRRALNAGAAAYVLKNTPKAEMLRVIRWVSEGRRHIPSEVASTIAEHLGQEELSERESSVLRLIRDGYRKTDRPRLPERIGTADEVAESVLFLASDKASFISGHGLALTARTPSPNWFSN